MTVLSPWQNLLRLVDAQIDRHYPMGMRWSAWNLVSVVPLVPAAVLYLTEAMGTVVRVALILGVIVFAVVQVFLLWREATFIPEDHPISRSKLGLED